MDRNKLDKGQIMATCTECGRPRVATAKVIAARTEPYRCPSCAAKERMRRRPDRMTAADLIAHQRKAGKLADTDGPDATTRAKRRDFEGPLHRAILMLMDMMMPKDAIWHHSPNELDMSGPAAARAVGKARQLGMVKGWPDLEIIWRERTYFIELKAGSGRVSDDQKDTHQRLLEAGARVETAYSVTEVEHILRKWGMIK